MPLIQPRAAAQQPVVTAALPADPSEVDVLWRDFLADERSPGSGLLDVAGVLSRVPAEGAAVFREVLVRGVGLSVARARGPYGRSATFEVLQRLRLVAALLASDESAAGAA